MPSELLRIFDSLITWIVLLTLFIVLIFHIASKIFKEDFDTFDYTVVATLMFILVMFGYIIVATAFQAMLYLNVLSLDNLWLFNTLLFTAYMIVFFVPTIFILHGTFMYLKTRLYVAFSYALSISLILTFLAGVT